MKYFSILILFFILSCSTQKEKLPVNLIPLPNHVTTEAGALQIHKQISIGYQDSKLENQVKVFLNSIPVNANVVDFEKATIKLEIHPGENNEAYTLSTTKKDIKITASSEKGIFYGLQTVKQMLLFAQKEDDNLKLPLLSVTDSPRFGWRGLMLDESRYFFGKEKIKQMLDFMALHKLNIFHWHLTDVPGWRIEIKQYPLLTTVGGKGNDIDPDAPARFYTQDDIREIVQYAADRFIEVIPEIDMPGHAKAANMAYPEFSGGGSKSHPEFTFNPGYEGTYTYLTNILREVKDLFPSKYIHLGGDEVHFGNESWNTNPHVKRLMKAENLKSLREVESYFIHRMADSIKMLDRTVIGWDEIVDFGLSPKNSVVMWWRHDKQDVVNNAFENGYPVVLCPRVPLYFDFDQNETHQYGRKWGGAFSPLEMVQAFPPDTLKGFTKHKNQVKGIQANIWTERIQTEERLDYMTYPRLSALAEAAWTNNEQKNIDDFKRRLVPMLDYYKSKNITIYNPFNPESTKEPIGLFRRNL